MGVTLCLGSKGLLQVEIGTHTTITNTEMGTHTTTMYTTTIDKERNYKVIS
jgi:hypothetical protein